jgi:hypothetical protein
MPIALDGQSEGREDKPWSVLLAFLDVLAPIRFNASNARKQARSPANKEGS